MLKQNPDKNQAPASTGSSEAHKHEQHVYLPFFLTPPLTDLLKGVSITSTNA